MAKAHVTLKIGHRDNRLGVAQARAIATRLESVHNNLDTKLIAIRSAADRSRTLSQLSKAPPNLYSKELEQALQKRVIDVAVLEACDLPNPLAEEFVTAALLERKECRDAYLGRTSIPLDKLPPKSCIGVSDLREHVLLQKHFPQLRPIEITGSIDLRLDALRNKRLKLSGILVQASSLPLLFPGDGMPTQILPLEKFVPAPGQGVLAAEVLSRREDVQEILQPLHHAMTGAAVQAERAIARRLAGEDRIPFGAYATCFEEGMNTILHLSMALSDADGLQVLQLDASGSMDDPEGVAEALETLARTRGAEEILRELRPQVPVRSRR